MVISKNGKQLISEGHENYRVLSGTVDNKNPKALYLSISAWGELILICANLEYLMVRNHL